MQITIDTLSVNIRDFLTRYQAWHHGKLLADPEKTSVIDFGNQGRRIPCFSDRDVEQINACQSPIVMIDSLNEGLNYISVYNEYDKNKHYLLFAPWFDQTKIKLPISYTPIWYSHLLFNTVDDYASSKSWYYHINRSYTFDYPKPCLFTTIAGEKTQRLLVKDTLINNLEKNSFIFRYGGQDFGRNINNVDIVDASAPGFVDVPQAVESQFPHIHNEPHHIYWKLISTAAHNMSYFNLVLESDMGNHRFFMTEKTIKPLLIGQPFVIYAGQGFLQHVKDLGFETFGALWDESYDQESDCEKRATMIAELCIRLKDFDWAGRRDQLQTICVKNQLRIHNLGAVAQREFVEFEAAIRALCFDK